MTMADNLLRFIAARFHVPPDALDYFLAARHIGKGSETVLPFPAELIPLGTRLALRGWLNNAFFPTNLDWILPYWAERQFDPNDPAFMPRGLNLYTINYTHRDWTMVGNLASEREAIVDPRGLVTPWFDGWSADIWVRVNGELYVPSRLPEGRVQQSLADDLPIVQSRFQAGGVDAELETYAVETGESDWVIEELTLQNQTPTPQDVTVYVSVRPFNPEGVSLVNRLEYRQGAGLGAFLVNGGLGALMTTPNAVATSDFAHGDVALSLPALNGQTRVKDQAGLATGVAAFEIGLGSGAPTSLRFLMPMRWNEIDDEDRSLPSFSISPVDNPLGEVVDTWRNKLAGAMRIRLPDEKMQNAFEANQAYLLLLHDGRTITPGPLMYHQFWFRDAAYMLNALDKMGYHEESRQVIESFPRYLEKDGYVRATEGEWDSNGAAIWAMVENAKLSGERELVARQYWTILRMASWINSKRRETTRGNKPDVPTFGLLPPGPSAEHLGPSDYYYWDDFWGLAGLRGAAEVAEWMGQEQDAAKLRSNYEGFCRDVDRSLAQSAGRIGRPAMPASPYRRLDSGMIGNLAALYPLRLFEPDDQRIVDTLAAIQQYAWHRGNYFNRVGHSAWGTYLSLHVAECMLMERRPEAWNIVQWVLDHATPTFTWAEGINPRTLGGGMGDGHHGWAVADWLIAVRNLLVLEEQDHLVITPVLPEDWTAENSVIKVENAPTYFGKVDYTIAFGERTGTLVIEGDWHKAPAYVEWDLPLPLREAGGDKEGVEIRGNTVRLEPDVKRVVVMW